MRYRVTEGRISEFPDPIVLTQGESVELGERSQSQEWPNWIWCKAGAKAGWVPEQIIEVQKEGTGLVLASYTAHELTIKQGDIILSDKELNGWVFGYTEGRPDEHGWVPLENVEEE